MTLAPPFNKLLQKTPTGSLDVAATGQTVCDKDHTVAIWTLSAVVSHIRVKVGWVVEPFVGYVLC